ncbi:MAG: peptidylprolyl isomerase [Wenzhouxiangellaceae bacterium]
MRNFILIFVFFLSAAGSASADDSAWLVKKNGVVVTLEDYEEFLLTMPEQNRVPFMLSAERFSNALDDLLLQKQLYEMADVELMLNQPEVNARISSARKKIIVAAWLDHIAAKEIGGEFEQRAYEIYLANSEDYMTSETLDVAHILISVQHRSSDEARKLIEQVSDKVKKNEMTFEDAAMQFSDDKGTNQRGGVLNNVARGQMVKPFEEAAFALSEVGQVSSIVETRFGFHLIKLLGRREPEPIPFDAVKRDLVEKVKSELQQAAKQRYVDAVKGEQPELNIKEMEAYLNQFQDIKDRLN